MVFCPCFSIGIPYNFICIKYLFYSYSILYTMKLLNMIGKITIANFIFYGGI